MKRIGRAAWKLAEGRIRFAVDCSSDVFFCAFECDAPAAFESKVNGEQMEVKSHPFQNRVLQNRDEVFKFTPNAFAYRDAPGAVPGASITELVRVVSRDDPATSQPFRSSSVVFNPMDLFRSNSRNTWEHFRPKPEYVDLLNGRKERRIDDGWLRITILGGGDNDRRAVTIVTQYAGGSGSSERVLATWRCRDECDFLPDRFDLEQVDRAAGTRRPTETIQWDYRREAAVLIPVRVHAKSFDENGELSYERELTLVESKVNEPLSEGALDQRALGLRDGDRLQDNLSGGESVYQKGAWVPEKQYVAERKGASYERSDRKKILRAWVIVGNIVFVVALLFGVRWLRRRRT